MSVSKGFLSILTIPEKSQTPRQKNNTNGKRGDKRTGRIPKSRCDTLTMKNGLVSFSTVAPGGNIPGKTIISLKYSSFSLEPSNSHFLPLLCVLTFCHPFLLLAVKCFCSGISLMSTLYLAVMQLQIMIVPILSSLELEQKAKYESDFVMLGYRKLVCAFFIVCTIVGDSVVLHVATVFVFSGS